MALSGAKPQKKTGILLVNLGSPDSPETPAVRRYLKEFLWDPRVVNLPRIVWWIILNFVVLPFRSGKSAKAYRKIWSETGSPLVYISQQLTLKLAEQTDDPFKVELAMRYGQPSIKEKLALFEQEQIEKLVILPLYPQYSSTTTASVFDYVIAEIKTWQHIPDFEFISDYYQNPDYIQAVSDSIRAYRDQHGSGEILLMSFHGLPERSIKLGDPYSEQCHKTASLIAENLNLQDREWQIVFQSRFGRAEWLKPYCVDVLQKLPDQGIKNIDIVCPGFSVDCLETLEEIAITNKSIFIDAGGVNYKYIPALNDSQTQIDFLKLLISEAI